MRRLIVTLVSITAMLAGFYLSARYYAEPVPGSQPPSSGSLTGVSTSIRLSHQTMTVVRQNLFFAFCYNIVLLPVAAGILAPFSWAPQFMQQLHPILAALAMAFSSVSVVSNSLRLYNAPMD